MIARIVVAVVAVAVMSGYQVSGPNAVEYQPQLVEVSGGAVAEVEASTAPTSAYYCKICESYYWGFPMNPNQPTHYWGIQVGDTCLVEDDDCYFCDGQLGYEGWCDGTSYSADGDLCAELTFCGDSGEGQLNAVETSIAERDYEGLSDLLRSEKVRYVAGRDAIEILDCQGRLWTSLSLPSDMSKRLKS